MVSGYNCTCLLHYTGEFQHEMTWSLGTTVSVFLTTLVSFTCNDMSVGNDTGEFQHVGTTVMTWSWVHDMVTGYNCICLLDYTGEFQHVMTWSVGTTVSVFLTTLVSFNM